MGKQIHHHNRKAKFNYEITDTLEVGMQLTGSEVKSIRKSAVDFGDSFVAIEHGEAWLYNLHISPYKQAAQFNHEPMRKRKLLLSKNELLKIVNKLKQSNLSLIPVSIHSRRWIKLVIGLGRGKKLFDKREAIKEKDLRREM